MRTGLCRIAACIAEVADRERLLFASWWLLGERTEPRLGAGDIHARAGYLNETFAYFV